jgi:hypothetical protein
METATELHNIDTINAGEVPTLDIVTEMDGFTPIPNTPAPAPLAWAPADAFPADNDGRF